MPVNFPASGGRVPDVVGAFGTKPEPVTVTVSPAGFRFVVFDTVTVGRRQGCRERQGRGGLEGGVLRAAARVGVDAVVAGFPGPSG